MLTRTLWLRHETKPYEERVALTPSAAKQLQMRGHDVRIEKSPTRIFTDEEYSRLGLPLEETNSWRESPLDTIVLGLKELEETTDPLLRRHIYFAHCYKGQDGSQELLARFAQGDGKLYDLEFLIDQSGKRIAAFGVWAGFVGAGLGVDFWVSRQLGVDPNIAAPLRPWTSSEDMILYLKDRLSKVKEIPKVLVIGARGRCGQGATKLLEALDIKSEQWNSSHTKNKGPFQEILDFDVLVNCALMMNQTKPFITKELLKGNKRLQIISDVGCDPTGPCNPLPVYDDITTMQEPARKLDVDNQDLWVTAIDHLPSLLPRESSEDFCQQLLPHLEKFLAGQIEDTPWERSLALFYLNLGKHGLDPDLGAPPQLLL